MNKFTFILSATTLVATLAACSKSTDEPAPTANAQNTPAPAVQEE